MPYHTILFDLDHTLLDSHASEALAYETTMRAVGVRDPASHFPTYDRINRELWAAVEAGRIRPDDVRVARFAALVAERNIDADPEEMADLFIRGLGAYGDLYPGAVEVLEALNPAATLALVTNGISEVQRDRIERLDLRRHFAAIVISGEAGVSKPAPGIFDIAFEALGHPAKGTALMVGDSLSSDIQGGRNYEIATCWYNPQGARPNPLIVPTYSINKLVELVDLASGD